MWSIRRMDKDGHTDDKEIQRKRVWQLIHLSALEVPGFAEFVDISLSHLYAILNGNRPLTKEMARRMTQKFKLKPEHLLSPGYEMNESIRRTAALLAFRAQERDVAEYFIETRDARKASFYVEHELIHSSIFKKDEATYLWQVRAFCDKEEKYYSSNQLSKLLKHQVTKGNLRSVKRPILKRDGTFGTRLVDVFFKV